MLNVFNVLCLQDEEQAVEYDPAAQLAHMESSFLFALVWSIGGTGNSARDRATFDAFLKHAVAGTLPAYTAPSGEKWVVGGVGLGGCVMLLLRQLFLPVLAHVPCVWEGGVLAGGGRALEASNGTHYFLCLRGCASPLCPAACTPC